MYIYSIRTEERFQSNEMAVPWKNTLTQTHYHTIPMEFFSAIIIIPSQMNTWVCDGRRPTILFAFNYILITQGWYKLISFFPSLKDD